MKESQNLEKKIGSEVIPPNCLQGVKSCLQYAGLLKYLEGEINVCISDSVDALPVPPSHLPLHFWTSVTLFLRTFLLEHIWLTYRQAWNAGELVLLEAVLSQ